LLNDKRLTDEHLPTESPAFVFDSGILAKVYIKKLKIIIIITLISMLVAAIWVSISVKPSWKAHCYIIRAPKNMSTPVEMPYLYQTFDINTILETVRTRDVLTDVINRLELDITTEELFRLIEVQRGNRSNILRFSVSWPDPEMAADIANTAAESFIYNNTQLLNSATMKIYNYYLDQQKIRLNKIEALERQYAQHRAEYGVISIPHESQAKFDQLKEVELKMIENRLHIKDMDSQIADMQEKIDALPDEVIQNWTYTRTDAKKLLQLQNELELLRSRYTDDNPKVQKLMNEIADLRKTMNESKRDLPEAVTWGPSGLADTYYIDKSRYESEREGAYQKSFDYQIEIDKIKSSLENLTQLQKEFFEIERQLELNREILRLVESRLAESKMAMQSNVSDYEILEEAKAPKAREGGHRKVMVIAIGFLIFLGASIYVLVKELLDSSTKSVKDFKELIRIPLMGILPDETEVEEKVYFRNLQVLIDKMLLVTNARPNPVICFGSDIAETGKSFLIEDCIEMLNHQKKKVLYIDTIKSLTPQTECCIINSWFYEDDERIMIDKQNPFTHYAYFLCNDEIFSKVLEKQRVQEFFDQLSEYDYIFWELAEYEYNVSLFSAIASASDMLVLIARFGRSSKSSLAHLTRYLGDQDFHKCYGVLNYVHKDFFHEYY
jgi:polysaccharide biosynthesis transport protein